MSMKSWTENGYGYCIEGADLHKTVNFIIQHTNYDEDAVKELKEVNDFEEVRDITDEPVCNILADIINELEDFGNMAGFDCDGDTDQPMMLGIEPAMPWFFKKNAKSIISQEQADAILNKYAETLGITEEPDYFEAEYFG